MEFKTIVFKGGKFEHKDYPEVSLEDWNILLEACTDADPDTNGPDFEVVCNYFIESPGGSQLEALAIELMARWR